MRGLVQAQTTSLPLLESEVVFLHFAPMKTSFLRFAFFFHFAMLAFVVLNALAAWATGWELQVIFPFKVLLILSGIGLALKEEVRKIKWYFRVYVGYYLLFFTVPIFFFLKVFLEL